MMDFITYFVNGGWMPIVGAVFVAAIAMTLFQPLFTEKNLQQRVKIISREVDDLKKYERNQRLREMRNSETAIRKQISARGADQVSERVRKFSDYSQKLNLDQYVNDKLRQKLSQAGYRREEYAYAFMLFKVIGVPLGILLGFWLVDTFGLESSALKKYGTIVGSTIFGFYFPDIMVTNERTKRQEELLLSFPDSLDLMVICVQSGMTLETSIRRVATELQVGAPRLSEEYTILAAELNYLKERRIAYENFAMRCGLDQVRDFTTAVIQSEIYGTSILQALRVQADELRNERMERAENKANSLPAKLTLPLAMFMLPVVFVIVLTPGLTNAIRSWTL